MPSERLGEIVVRGAAPRNAPTASADPTASAVAIDTRDAPATVETMADALGSVAGVQVRRFGGLGDFTTVSVRGYAPGQVQVYLDGVPLTRAQNEVVNLAELPLDVVDHVEVYKGTTPLAFAQSSPGGVVNIVTRKPGTEPVTAASASYGSFDTRKVDVARGATAGKWDYLVFGHYLGSASDFPFDFDQTSARPSPERVRRRNAGFDQADGLGRLVYHLDSTTTLALTTDTYWRSGGVADRQNLKERPFGHLDTLRQLGNLDLHTSVGTAVPVTIDASAWGIYEHRDHVQPVSPVLPASERVDQRTAAGGGQVVLRSAIGTHQVPGMLLAFSREQFDTSDSRCGSDIPSRTRLHGSLAVQDELVFFDERLSIVPSVRWERFADAFPRDPCQSVPLQRSGQIDRDLVAPHLGLRYEAVPGVTFLANAGRYERAPNFVELFGDEANLRGQPDLAAESGIGWDVGFRWLVPSRWTWLDETRVEYSYFDNQIDDLIQLIETGVGRLTFENVGRASIRGHELSTQARFAQRLRMIANYTHQDPRDTTDRGVSREGSGKILPGRPRDEAYLRLELGWSPTMPLPIGVWARDLWPGRVFYELDWIGGNHLLRSNDPSGFIASRGLHAVGLDVTLPFHGVRLALEMRNFTDDQTRDAFGFPLPGRSFFGTLSWGFGRDS